MNLLKNYYFGLLILYLIAKESYSLKKSATISKTTPKSAAIFKTTPKSAAIFKTSTKSAAIFKTTPKSATIFKTTPKSATIFKTSTKSAAIFKTTPKSTTHTTKTIQECDALIGLIKDVNGECICNSAKGFWKNSNGQCERIDPCDKRLKKCQFTNCISLNEDLDKGYHCYCDDNYKIGYDNGIKFCIPQKCKSPLLNTCSQICTDGVLFKDNYKFDPEFICECNDGYHLSTDNKTCIENTDNINRCKTVKCNSQSYCSDGKCICKNGFINDNKGTCVIDQSWCDEHCPEKSCIIYNNDHIACNCTKPKYNLNTNTGFCKLITHCGDNDDGSIDCERKNAYCEDDYNNRNGYKCTCPIGTVEDSVTGQCIDICKIKKNIDKCTKLNAKCVFDINYNENFLCECFPQMVRSQPNEKCLLSEYAMKISMDVNVKNFDESSVQQYTPIAEDEDKYDPKGWLKEHKQMETHNNKIGFKYLNQKMVRNVLKDYEKIIVNKANHILSVTLLNYTIKSDQLYEIELTVQFDDIPINITKILKCEPTINGKYCKIGSNILVKKNDYSYAPIDPCADPNLNLCSKYKYSKCHKIPVTSAYECRCDNKYFKAEDNANVIIGYLNKKPLLAQTCVPIDQCHDKKPCKSNDNEECHNHIGPGPNGLGYECRCKINYKNINGKCVPVCDGVNCNGHGKCSAAGNYDYKCVCYDGFSGNDCGVETNAKNSNKIWIYAISGLSLVLVICVIVMAYTCGRLRGRKNRFNQNNITQLRGKRLENQSQL